MTRRQITVLVPHASWDPDRSDRAPRGRRRAVELARTNSYRLPSNNPSATQGGGASGLPTPPRLLQRRLPLQRADAGRPEPERGQRPRMVARERAGARAHERRHQPVLRRTSTSTSSPRRSTTTCPASRAASRRPARWTASWRATSRPSRAPHSVHGSTSVWLHDLDPTTGCKGWYRGQLQPYAIYVPAAADAGRRLRADAAAALARRQLQPVPRQPQPVPVRRARGRARS